MRWDFTEWNEGTLAGVFGWDGDKDAAVASPDGSFLVRDGRNLKIEFGVAESMGRYRWFNAEGYLPCLVTETDAWSVSNFADKVSIGGRDYVVAYSRVKTGGTNPHASRELVRLDERRDCGESVFDYAIAIDRFGEDIPWPTTEEIIAAGTWDEHYAHMKAYWDGRLAEIADVQTPDPLLNDAYKAGFIYTHIVKDGLNLHVGENGYDGMWDHDAIGILAAQILIGCLKEAPALLRALPRGWRYDDAVWKFCWPFAIYLQKTGDRALIEESWQQLTETAHQIAADRTGVGRTMKETEAIDTRGCWTIDDWSAMTGLLAYRYLASQTGREAEAEWARNEYLDLLECSNTVLAETMAKHGLNYIPASLLEPNDANRTKEPDDANWAAHLLFGRWAWDGFLLGGEQHGPNLDLIDATYDYGFARLRALGLPEGTFGGYPAGWKPMYSSSYNAGYGSAALRGDKHRTVGVRAYRFLIDNCQSGPHSYWENVSPPGDAGWEGTHPAAGNGSCPHMWGQSVATKVLLDSIAAEFFDGRLLIGRGVPEEWLEAGPVEVRRFPICNGRRVDIRISKAGSTVILELSGDLPRGEVIFDLPLFQGRAVALAPGQVRAEVALE